MNRTLLEGLLRESYDYYAPIKPDEPTRPKRGRTVLRGVALGAGGYVGVTGSLGAANRVARRFSVKDKLKAAYSNAAQGGHPNKGLMSRAKSRMSKLPGYARTAYIGAKKGVKRPLDLAYRVSGLRYLDRHF